MFSSTNSWILLKDKKNQNKKDKNSHNLMTSDTFWEESGIKYILSFLILFILLSDLWVKAQITLYFLKI